MALAFTCRQIYREVTPIYYSENFFHIPSGINSLREFAAVIGPANAKSITTVEIPICPLIVHLSRQQLKELWPFPNLKILVYFEIPGFERRLPRVSHTVAVFPESEKGHRLKENPKWYDIVEMIKDYEQS